MDERFFSSIVFEKVLLVKRTFEYNCRADRTKNSIIIVSWIAVISTAGEKCKFKHYCKVYFVSQEHPIKILTLKHFPLIPTTKFQYDFFVVFFVFYFLRKCFAWPSQRLLFPSRPSRRQGLTDECNDGNDDQVGNLYSFFFRRQTIFRATLP